MIKACKARTNGSIRDRAFMPCLRVSGCARANCATSNWKTSTGPSACCTSEKQVGNGRTLPLPADAGALLAEYIRAGSEGIYREIFLSAHPPHLAFGRQLPLRWCTHS